MTKEYIKEIGDHANVRPLEPQYINGGFRCDRGQNVLLGIICAPILIGGSLGIGLGISTNVAGILWSSVSVIGGACLWVPSIEIIHRTRRKIYYIKNKEYRKFQEETKEIANKPYNYPALFECVERSLSNEESEIYDKTQEILEDSNSNSDFQKKREKMQEDYEILKWKIIWGSVKVLGGRNLKSELESLNQVIAKLAEKKWLIAKKLLNFLLVNKRASNGLILDVIFQTEGNCFPKDLNIRTICAAIEGDEKSSNESEVFERQVTDALEIISKNNIGLLGLGKEKDNGPSTMSMR